MKNTYEIRKGPSGFVFVQGKKYNLTLAADVFRLQMYNTFKAMQDGNVSKKLKLTIEEV